MSVWFLTLQRIWQTGLVIIMGLGLVFVLGLGLMLTLAGFSETSASLRSGLTSSSLTTDQTKIAMQARYEQAQAVDDITLMLDTVIKLRALQPDDKQLRAEQAQLYYRQGLNWQKTNRFEAARHSFNWALSVQPDFSEADEAIELIELYQAGIEQYRYAQWAEAVAMFKLIYEIDPAYRSVNEILYSSYFNLGITQEIGGDLTEALKSYRRAIEIIPNAPEAIQNAEKIALKLNPPTSESSSEENVTKRVVVDISDQRTYVYENEDLVFEFVVSTGEPGRDTAIGEYEIQSKIPMAYASTWNLDMPFWLGIYWAGPLENGFHAVPTVRHTGETMWDGYLGQRVSYGCIILSMEDAEILYDWAELAVPVTVQL